MGPLTPGVSHTRLLPEPYNVEGMHAKLPVLSHLLLKM
jgi:hypothetical protein